MEETLLNIMMVCVVALIVAMTVFAVGLLLYITREIYKVNKRKR